MERKKHHSRQRARYFLASDWSFFTSIKWGGRILGIAIRCILQGMEQWGITIWKLLGRRSDKNTDLQELSLRIFSQSAQLSLLLFFMYAWMASLVLAKSPLWSASMIFLSWSSDIEVRIPLFPSILEPQGGIRQKLTQIYDRIAESVLRGHHSTSSFLKTSLIRLSLAVILNSCKKTGSGIYKTNNLMVPAILEPALSAFYFSF